jgi:hypothetical protein
MTTLTHFAKLAPEEHECTELKGKILILFNLDEPELAAGRESLNGSYCVATNDMYISNQQFSIHTRHKRKLDHFLEHVWTEPIYNLYSFEDIETDILFYNVLIGTNREHFVRDFNNRPNFPGKQKFRGAKAKTIRSIDYHRYCELITTNNAAAILGELQS